MDGNGPTISKCVQKGWSRRRHRLLPVVRAEEPPPLSSAVRERASFRGRGRWLLLFASPYRRDPAEFCGQTLDGSETEVECIEAHVSDLRPLTGLSKLKELDLSDTPVGGLKSLAALSNLKTQLPNLDVIDP